MRDSHDLMRGVPGNFDKAMETRANSARAEGAGSGVGSKVHINTVITRDNLDEVLPLAEWILREAR